MNPNQPKYPIGGYAPGNYMNHCVTCTERFMGDKRATQCEPCAIETTKQMNPNPQSMSPEDRLLFEKIKRSIGSYDNNTVTSIAEDIWGIFTLARQQAAQENPNKSLIDLEAERLEWSLKTFPEATPLRQLKQEIEEIEIDYADALMCLFDSAGRQGITIQEIIDAFAMKLEKNKSRTWKKNPDNSYSHVKNPNSSENEK